jgi:hypothetical protein
MMMQKCIKLIPFTMRIKSIDDTKLLSELLQWIMWDGKVGFKGGKYFKF